MSFDPNASGLCIGIVGTGAMGRGIAQIAAQAGLTVLLFDTRATAVDEARAALSSTWEKLAEKGRIEKAEVERCSARLVAAATLTDLAPADLVVEAIVEDLETKRALFKSLEEVVAPTAVLASNTSSLSITAIARATSRPERVVGWHFFNPVPLMKVVEVVDGLGSDPSHGDALMALSRRLGHTAVRAKDTPGFIVNHAGRGYGTEALRIVGEGVCEFADVDRIMREACGFRLGPFELMDLTALDVSHPVMESIYRQFYDEPRFRPSVITAQRLAGNWLGRKTQRGFYDYRPGAEAPHESPADAPLPRSLWISARDPAARTQLLQHLHGSTEIVDRPEEAEIALVMPFGSDATSAALAEGCDPRRTVALDPLTPLTLRRTLMKTSITEPALAASARALLSADGVPVTLIHDSPGFVAQRILAAIVNIAADIAQQRIAAPADIDLAVQLGLNYPQGPLALGDRLGPARVLSILDGLYEATRDPRYRPSLWLSRRARLNVSLTTPES